MNSKTTLIAAVSVLAFALVGLAETSRPIPTNSLAFHLKSLGRVPTAVEREMIEAALHLMWRHEIRSDYPLRLVYRNDDHKEWVLRFDSGYPDAWFDLFISHKDSHFVEVHYQLAASRIRYPARPAIKKEQ